MFTFQHVEARVDRSKPLLPFRTSGKEYHSQVNSIRKEEDKNMLKQYPQDEQRIIDLRPNAKSCSCLIATHWGGGRKTHAPNAPNAHPPRSTPEPNFLLPSYPASASFFARQACMYNRQYFAIFPQKRSCYSTVKPKRETNIAEIYEMVQGVLFYWSHPKSFKYGTGPTQEMKMTGPAKHIENG